jgi:hypothetical protein
MPDDSRYPSARVYIRHAAGLDAPAPSRPLDPQATLASARRGSGCAPIGDLSAADLQLLEARRELQAAQARLKHLEQALRTAGPGAGAVCQRQWALSPFQPGRESNPAIVAQSRHLS